MMNKILIFLIGVAGFPAGMLLARIAQDEMKEAKKYLPRLQQILFLAIVVCAVVFSLPSRLPVAVLMALGVVLLFPKRKVFEVVKYIYFLIAYLFLGSLQFQLTFASLIFLYGLPTGSYDRKRS